MKKLTYTALSAPFEYEIPKIKGSRFLTQLFPAHSKEEFESQLTRIRKEHYNATHNCYAYRIGIHAHQDLFGNRNCSPQRERANDDGEPSNTAGKPMLAVLSGEAVFEIWVVVTRYFGGTLLGVGGLIQAYTEATKLALQAAPKEEREVLKSLKLLPSYEQLAQSHYLVNKYEGRIMTEEYGTTIEQEVSLNVAFVEGFLHEAEEKQLSILI